MFLVKFQYSEESFLRNLHIAYLLHALLSLLLKKLALTADVATVAFRCHILSYALDSLSSNDFCTYSSLYSNIKLLSRYEFLKLFTHSSAQCHSVVNVCESRECVNALAIKEDIMLSKL